MRGRVSRETLLALAVALARTAFCIWRAARQSLVHDEALTFNLFLNGPWSGIYFHYQVNNHVLFSLLAKASMTLFGPSEWALRLPTVIAGFFFMAAVWRILEFAESPAVRWCGYLVIALHPMLLDFSVAARGYGLSLALLAWAMAVLMAQRTRRDEVLAGVFLGLAISANFTAGLPAAGVIVAAAILEKGSIARRLKLLATVALPALAVFAAICGGVLPLLQRQDFVAGFPALYDSLFNLVLGSIHATPRNGLVNPQSATRVLIYAGIPAVAALIGIQLCLRWRAGVRSALLPSLALAISAAAMFAAHFALGVLYPVDRTGVLWILLFLIAWAVAAGSHGSPWLRGANIVAAAVLAVQFTTQLHAGYFTIWWYDSASKNLAQRLQEETRDRPPESVSIAATWIHQPALEFYRVRDGASAWKPIERRDPTVLSGYDYYVLNAPDTQRAEARAFTTLFADPFSGAMLISGAMLAK